MEDDEALVARIEGLFDRGYTPDRVITELNLKGDLPKERRCLEVFRDRQKLKEARVKRFAAPPPEDAAATGDAKRARPAPAVIGPGGHMTWVFERDATVEDRLAAPLPVKREKPVTKPPAPDAAAEQSDAPEAQHHHGAFHPGEHFGGGGFSRGRGGYRGRGGPPQGHWRGAHPQQYAPWRGNSRGRGVPYRGRRNLPFSVGIEWQQGEEPTGQEAEAEQEGEEGADQGPEVPEGESDAPLPEEAAQHAQPRPHYQQQQHWRGHPPPHFYRGRGRGGYPPRGQPWRGRGGYSQYPPRGAYRGGHRWSGPPQHAQYGNQSWTPNEVDGEGQWDEHQEPDNGGDGDNVGDHHDS